MVDPTDMEEGNERYGSRTHLYESKYPSRTLLSLSLTLFNPTDML
jgi:hypothetical protein